MPAVKPLHKDRSFAFFNATQFLGAMNDNVFKGLMIFALIQTLTSEAAISQVNATAAAIFVLPFLLFTTYGGKLADRYSKRDILVLSTAVEIVNTILAVGALAWGNPLACYACLFAISAQSAFFGPSKYGVVPELVDADHMCQANASLEALTYGAIVLGTAAPSALGQITGGRYALSCLACVAIATGGFLCSMQIRRTEPVRSKDRSSWFFPWDVYRTLHGVRRDRGLIWAVWGAAIFLTLGAFLQINLIPYGKAYLGFTSEQSGYLFLLAAVGIGLGSLMAGYFSGRNIGIVPMGALGLGATVTLISILPPVKALIFPTIVAIGFFAGMFIVPLQTHIQMRSPRRKRGRIIAASNLIGWCGVLLASVLTMVLSKANLTSRQSFGILGVATFALAILSIHRLKDFFVRFCLLIPIRIAYRIRAIHVENVPMNGGALLVANHISLVDALILGSTQQRRIRFVMERGYFNRPLIGWFCRMMGAIPIDSTDSPKKIIASLQAARKALDEGFMVGIFAEGAMTRTGFVRRFRGGFERIVRHSEYPIIPIYIGGIWGSIWSYFHGRLFNRFPLRCRVPIDVVFGKPLPAASTPEDVYQAVLELGSEYHEGLKVGSHSLAEEVLRIARRRPLAPCMSDTSGRRLNYLQVMTGARIFAGRIRRLAGDQPNIGILLPQSCPAALANIAVSMLGKTSVNLSYVTSDQIRATAIEQAGLKVILTSKLFIHKASIPARPDFVYLEDLAAGITNTEKIAATLATLLLPAGMQCRRLAGRKIQPDDLATIIFSSGSSGIPKGVMLSHYNILSNIQSLLSIFRVESGDHLCGILPFFHSFGYTATLWLPMLARAGVTFVPNPLDARLVAETIKANRSTLLFATPTFLTHYTRRAEPDELRSLRFIFTGAEKLRQFIADDFEKKFGIRPMEGYGTTELSPIVSINLPDVTCGGLTQVAGKLGTIGHPAPGIAARVIDIDTGKPLSFGQQGLLCIKGPNVMRGYLDQPEKTSQVLQNGWYNTGDIATIDEDGFVTITDRLSRFSKIGGEMVGHLAVEDICMRDLGTGDQLVAVTSVPDLKKGEELVVLYVAGRVDGDLLHRKVSESSLPNLCKPKRDRFLPVEAIPTLGSGKLDVMKLKQLAMAAIDKTDPGVRA
jgi:acyl-[acyl-carrier-protein]-phospholipid O-acyltransferase/long-chain-fatty-acid--[acyl-carrier-protein] ligase